MRVLLSASCSGKPVVSIASKRARNSRLFARSRSTAACETSLDLSFQRRSPRIDAN
jgi:hypothetical protein